MNKAYTIVVTGGRAGLGRTQVACNLALALQQHGRRTLLIDLELGTDNFRPVFGMSPSRSFEELLGGRVGLLELLAEGPGDLTLLRGGPELENVAALPANRARNLLAAFGCLESMFDFIVLDAGLGASVGVLTFVRSANEALALTTPGQEEVGAAYQVLKMVARSSPSTSIALCVNFAQSEADAEAAYRMSSVARSLFHTELRVAGTIREDAAVRMSEREQRPVFLHYPTSGFARDIKSLASFWARRPSPIQERGLVERLAEELSPVAGAVG